MNSLLWVFAVLGYTACVLAIPSSLLTDVKQAEMSHGRLTNKVKRAQEVIMFGNQQNRGGDGRNAFSLPRAEKRGVDLEENVLAETGTEPPHEPYPPESEVLEEPKVLAQSYRPSIADPEYAQRLQNTVLKSEYFTDPASLTDLRYYELDERRKRETFRTPSKRSSRGLAGRAKRDLDLDPEELLALLAYWENERRNKLQQNRNMYNQYNAMDSDDLEMLENQEAGNELPDEDENRAEGWMDGPVALPPHHFSAGPRADMYPRQFSDDRRKRFMVSKRRSQEGDMYSLAQLLNTPQRESAPPVFRRYVL